MLESEFNIIMNFEDPKENIFVPGEEENTGAEAIPEAEVIRVEGEKQERGNLKTDPKGIRKVLEDLGFKTKE